MFDNFSLSSSKLLHLHSNVSSASNVLKDDPLYEPETNNSSTPTSATTATVTTPTTLVPSPPTQQTSLSTSSLAPPNKTPHQKRKQSSKPSSIPPPQQKVQNTAFPASSPIDIFERNVQSEDSTLLFNSPSRTNSMPSGNSLLLASPTPRHLMTEDLTSPILDSTVELIQSKQFNDVDVVQVPHSTPSQQLFKTHSQNSIHSVPPQSAQRNNSLFKSKSRSKSIAKSPHFPVLCTCNTNNTSNSTSNTCTPLMSNASSPPSLPSSNRKSISFYSYLDLVNYERMSNSNNNSKNDLNNGPNYDIDCPKHGNHHPSLSRRSTFQGLTEDSDAKIDDALNLNLDDDDDKDDHSDDDKKSTNTKEKYVRKLVYEPIDISSSAIVDDNDNESIQSWKPADSNIPPFNRSKSRSQSIVDELASLKSFNTNNSYFEDELDSTEHNHNMNGSTSPLVNVCSANDYLNLRTRELRNSFVAHPNTSGSFLKNH